MKVWDVTRGPSGAVTGKTSDRKIAGAGDGLGKFEDNLNKERSDRMEEMLTVMLEDIEEQGKRMADSLNLRELVAYKSKVRAFIEEVVTGMYKFTKSSLMTRRGRHRVYSLVKRINKNLEELTKDMVGGQKERLAILEKVGSIRGLLVDLYT